MALDRTDVEKIAFLARLATEENELPGYVDDLSNILKLVEQMDTADTSNVEPMAHPLDMAQRLRDDEVTEQNQRDNFQEIAPQVESGLYLVPKVLE